MPSGYHRDANGNLVSNLGPQGPKPKSNKYARDRFLTPFLESELETVRECATLYCSDAEIGHELNFRYDDWLKVKEEHPEIQEVIEAGKSAGEKAIRMMQFKNSRRLLKATLT